MASKIGSIPIGQEQPIESYWKNIVIAIAIVAVWFGIFFNEVVSTVEIWLSSDTYAHGIFILPLSIWLFWRHKKEFLALQAKPSYIAALFTVILLLLWFVAQLMEIDSLTHLITFMLLSCLLWLVFGDGLLKRFTFPLFFILFCAPFGNSLIPYLQVITAKITVYFLQLSQIPVFYEGLYITVPSGLFEVAVACSGIRYLIASLAIGSLYAHLSYQHWAKKLVFILFAIIFPIFANGIRAYLIVIIAYMSDMKYATGVDHLVYGWLFFGLVIYLMFAIGNVWADAKPASQMSSKTTVVPKIPKLRFIALGVSLALMVVVTFKAYSLKQSIAPEKAHQIAAEKLISHQSNAASGWGVKFNHALSIYHGKGADGVEVFKAKFAHKQSQGKLITSTNLLYNPELWSKKSSRIGGQKLNNQNINYSELTVVRADGQHRLIRYWYTIDEQHYAKKWQTKVGQGIAQLLNTSAHGTVNALSLEYTNIGEEETIAQVKIEQWMLLNFPSFERLLNE